MRPNCGQLLFNHSSIQIYKFFDFKLVLRCLKTNIIVTWQSRDGMRPLWYAPSQKPSTPPFSPTSLARVMWSCTPPIYLIMWLSFKTTRSWFPTWEGWSPCVCVGCVSRLRASYSIIISVTVKWWRSSVIVAGSSATSVEPWRGAGMSLTRGKNCDKCFI